jgi:hypothetical protein
MGKIAKTFDAEGEAYGKRVDKFSSVTDARTVPDGPGVCMTV